MKTDPTWPHFVYVCRDAQGVVLYVGCTVDVDRRKNQHRTTTWWWAQVADVTHSYCRDMAAGRAEELRLIKHHVPVYNQHGLHRSREWLMARDTERNDWYSRHVWPIWSPMTEETAAWVAGVLRPKALVAA